MHNTYSAGVVTAYGAAKKAGYTGTYEEFCAEQAQFAQNAQQVREDKESVEQTVETFEETTVPAAVQAVTDEGTTQVGRVNQAGSSQVESIGEAGTTQVGNVNQAGSTQVAAVNQAGATQIQAVEDKGDEVIESIPEDYTQLSEDVDDLKNALAKTTQGNPIAYDGLSLVGVTAYLPFAQEGSGTPSQQNIRDFTTYSQFAITDGTSDIVRIQLPATNGAICEAAIDFQANTITVKRYIKVFDGTETLSVAGPQSQNFVYTFNSTLKGKTNSRPASNMFESSAYVYDYTGTEIKVSFGISGYEERIIFLTPPGTYNKNSFIANVLKAQYDAGHPVTVSYELETPIVYSFAHEDISIAAGTTVSASAGTMTITSVFYVKDYVAEKFTWETISKYMRSKFVTHMTHSGIGTYIANDTRNAIIHPLHFDFDIDISLSVSGMRFAVQLFDGYETGRDHLLSASAWINSGSTYTVPSGAYFCMIVGYQNDAGTDDTTQNALEFNGVVNIYDVYDKLMPVFDDYLSLNNSKNYLIGSSFAKTPVSITRLGQVKYLQSFCKYNGYYYSTDGSNISKQDADFTEISTTAISVGHGNSFQLGSGGLAYISGWDDQNLYVIDLDTITLDSVITLPTTGYTTCAVDEARNLIYIFQRDSYPSTEDYYNFIVYNYDTDQVVSTRKISFPFAAMQACDFCEDRIVMQYGLGTSAAPAGCKVFDLSGNVIGEYFFPDFSGVKGYEPEGVFVDRSTKDLYLGLNGRAVYKVDFDL